MILLDDSTLETVSAAGVPQLLNYFIEVNGTAPHFLIPTNGAGDDVGNGVKITIPDGLFNAASQVK